MLSDPTITDSDRTGLDLLARLAELHRNQTGDGWRPLLLACEREIVRLRAGLNEAAKQFESYARHAADCGWMHTADEFLNLAANTRATLYKRKGGAE